MFENYKNCALNKVYTVEINKIALSSNDHKRLQTFDKITTYPRGTNAFKVYESEMMMVRSNYVKNYTNWFILSNTAIKFKKKAKQATMSFVAEVIPLIL